MTKHEIKTINFKLEDNAEINSVIGTKGLLEGEVDIIDYNDGQVKEEYSFYWTSSFTEKRESIDYSEIHENIINALSKLGFTSSEFFDMEEVIEHDLGLLIDT